MFRAAKVSYCSRVLYGAPTHRPLRMFMVGIVIVIVDQRADIRRCFELIYYNVSKESATKGLCAGLCRGVVRRGCALQSGVVRRGCALAEFKLTFVSDA